jgi:hypothetical protein
MVRACAGPSTAPLTGRGRRGEKTATGAGYNNGYVLRMNGEEMVIHAMKAAQKVIDILREIQNGL